MSRIFGDVAEAFTKAQVGNDVSAADPIERRSNSIMIYNYPENYTMKLCCCTPVWLAGGWLVANTPE